MDSAPGLQHSTRSLSLSSPWRKHRPNLRNCLVHDKKARSQSDQIESETKSTEVRHNKKETRHWKWPLNGFGLWLIEYTSMRTVYIYIQYNYIFIIIYIYIKPTRPVKKRQPWRSPDTWRRYVHWLSQKSDRGGWSVSCCLYKFIGSVFSSASNTAWDEVTRPGSWIRSNLWACLQSEVLQQHDTTSGSLNSMGMFFFLHVLAGGTLPNTSLPSLADFTKVQGFHIYEPRHTKVYQGLHWPVNNCKREILRRAFTNFMIIDCLSGTQQLSKHKHRSTALQGLISKT